MEKTPVVIAGTGAEAKIALEIFSLCDVFVYGFVTDDEEKIRKDLNDVSIFGRPDDAEVISLLKGNETGFFIAEGDIRRRKELAILMVKPAGRPPINAIHPASSIAKYAKIGIGNLINAYCCLDPDSTTGDYNVFHSHVSVGTDTKVGHYNTMERGVRIGGNVKIGNEVFIGTGAVIYPGVKIGDGVVIGAGSVVLKEVKKGNTVFGNPASEIQK